MRKNPKLRKKELMIGPFNKFQKKFHSGELNAKNKKALINKQLNKLILPKKLQMTIIL